MTLYLSHTNFFRKADQESCTRKSCLNPRGLFFLFVFEVWAGNSNWSFDAEFLKPLVLIDLFIMNMRM